MAKSLLSDYLTQAEKTNSFSKVEAVEFFNGLHLHTHDFLEKEFKYAMKNNWPIKAQRVNQAEKEPVFCVVHHTSNKSGNYKPAMHRFFAADMASSNFLIGRQKSELLYLVDVKNKSFHAVRRAYFPPATARAFKLEGGFVNEIGTEVAGNGGTLLFSYEQFINLIVCHRFLRAYYPSIKELKSHRWLSPVSRAGDPGPLMFLPLVEHAVMNDIDLNSQDYWLSSYKRDPVAFANLAKHWMVDLGVADRDEWSSKRKIIINNSYLLK